MLKINLSLLREVVLARVTKLSDLASKYKISSGKVNTARINPRLITSAFKQVTWSRDRVRFYTWIAVAYVLSLYLMLLLIRIAFSGNALTELAVKNGQSITVHVATGTVTGGKFGDGDVSTGKGIAGINNKVEGGDGLAPVPLPSLTEQTDKGVLPTVAHDGSGLIPWKYYGRPFTSQDSKRPLVAIVFTNLGLSRPQTEETLKLPHEFTLGFSPYAGDIARWAAKSRTDGFESVVDLPVQTDNYPFSDPGPYGLLEDLSPDENISRLHSILMEFPGFVGVLASDGEVMTINKDEIKPYLVELKKRGLLFLYLKTDKNKAFADYATTNFFYVLGIDRMVDTVITRSAIDMQLQDLVNIAKKQGYAIGLVHSYPPTLEELANWTPTLYDQGVDLAPVTAVANRVFP